MTKYAPGHANTTMNPDRFTGYSDSWLATLAESYAKNRPANVYNPYQAEINRRLKLKIEAELAIIDTPEVHEADENNAERVNYLKECLDDLSR